MFTRMLSTKTSITTLPLDWLTARRPRPLADRANCTTASRPPPTLVAEGGHAAGPRVPAQFHPAEAAHQVARATIQGHQVRAADLPAAGDLADHQLAVAERQDAGGRGVAAGPL